MSEVKSLSPHSTDEFISKHPHNEYANTNLPERSLSFPQLADYIKKYQDPSQADSIMKIQQELDQTKIVLYVTSKQWGMLADVNIDTKLSSPCWSEVRSLQKSVCGILADYHTGEKIDSLVAKSDGLSAQSKMFYTQGMSLSSVCEDPC